MSESPGSPSKSSLQEGAQPVSEPSPSQGTEALSRRLEELNRQIASTMETAARDVANVGRRATHDLLDAVRRLDSEETQNGILQALLESGRQFASRTAFFLTQGDSFLGWGGQGFGHATSEVAGLEIPFGGPWQSLSQGLGAVALDPAGCATLSERVGGLAGSEGLLVPFVVRGRLAGAFYADRVSGDGDLAEASLMLLTHCASLAVEIVAFRERGASPALSRSADGDDAGGVPLWQGGDSAPAASEPEPVAVEPEPVAAEPEPEPEAVAVDAVEPEPVVAEPEPVVEPEPEPEPVVEPAFEESAVPEIQVEEPEPTFQPIAAEPVAETVEEVEEEGDLQPFTFETPAVEPEPIAELETPAEPELTVETEPEALFETTEPAPAPEEIEPTEEDLRPEPELEDTSTGIWSLEEAPAVEVEDEDEDDEPTAVGEQAVVLDPPTVEDVAVEEVAAEEVAVEDVAADGVDDEPTIVGQQTVRLDLATLQGQAAANAQGEPEPVEPVGATDTAAVETPVFQTPEVDTPAVEPGAFDTSSAYVPPPAEPEPEAPAAVEPPPAFSPEPSSAYVPPPAESKPADGGSTQVQPPADHDGPGTAFLASTESDEALHEEARRLARLLVSEIKLYNEEVIEEGRRNHDIYERLKDDIDRSRQMYQERIDPRLQGRDDYFYEELVQRLAGGDASALAMPR